MEEMAFELDLQGWVRFIQNGSKCKSMGYPWIKEHNQDQPGE